MRIASSLTRDFSSFAAGVLRVVAFLRGDVAFLAVGFAAFPFSAAPSDGAFSLSLASAFFAMAYTVIALPGRVEFASRFRKELA